MVKIIIYLHSLGQMYFCLGKFSIHGGWVAGSAGCIDMTSKIQEFVVLFGFIGKDLIVTVKY